MYAYVLLRIVCCLIIQIEIIHAWYGVDGGVHTEFATDGRRVSDVVRSWVGVNSIDVPNVDFNTIFGDPEYGTPKIIAVHLRVNGVEKGLRILQSDLRGGVTAYTRFLEW